MERTPVKSSQLVSVGYDPTEHVLEIEFQDGGIYHYFGVPPAVHSALMKAHSHGKYFNATIKGQYLCEEED